MKVFKNILIWLFIGVLNALLLWAIILLFTLANYGLGIVISVFLVITDWAIFSSKAYPYRYTLPALFFLFILTIYPIYYTIDTAFTNYGTGHLFTRTNAIDTLLTDSSYYYEPSDPKTLDFKVFVRYDEQYKPTEDFILLLYDQEDMYLAEKPLIRQWDSKNNLIYAESEMFKVQNDMVIKEGATYEIIRPSGSLSTAGGDSIIAIEKGDIRYTYFYSPLDSTTSSNSSFYNSVLRQNYLKSLVLKYENKNFKLSSSYVFRKFSEAYRVYETMVKVIIDGEREIYKTVVVNTLTNKELIEKDAAFWDYNENGNLYRLIGYKDYVGLNNFSKIIKDPRISGPFFKIFGWTFAYAALSVLFTFIIGLAFALILNDNRLKGRILYRTLLIIPWAIPAFISVLVWRNGFFNETYGVINRFVLANFGINPVKWLNDPFWAKVAVLIVNTWLGFPYMMTITLGSLQSIPEDLYEAAVIDGASRWKQFIKITFPLLMVSVAPLLVMSFAFNFNNFTNIYLLTGGGPAMAGTNTPAGSTDILISYVYKLAFEGSHGQDFGFASAISILIFGIIAIFSYFNFKFSGSFEEVSR
ncbi:ABC transporter permease subunit [Defluviitoga tunisiensis]|jgi:maltose/maltodextrin transport system permease protein|uniref:Maltose/maltodextrin transport system permease protein n=1 Tax=Defluviitoga tunisiensis TaxID=1006576 RepID=A0A0C7P2M9_DEFTU|nr:ABC transporter permease subunit [Defluviitoga tunisiensis]CEP78585.1 maltose transporter membrane protein [Defluviitoga tunisiensis]